MRSISDSIETIGQIIDELSMDAAKIAEFKKQYEKLSLRSKDPNFYLSTIGDFSSGKSTLINTLIKRKLLKVAYAATTAVPTYIYRGTSKRVIVKAKCVDGGQYDITTDADVQASEKKYGVALPRQIDERISLLTADKKLSLQIKEVAIELPDDELMNGLCVIDTPGINPGTDDTGNHAALTKYVLNEIADAIIILFPADQAYTQAFEEFLKENAEYFMKDAIFVVTMMDRIDEEERGEVLSFVKANLRDHFGLNDPQVLSCSAMLSGKDPYWTENFAAFEHSLMDKLSKNRQRIVAERLVKLANTLLLSMQSEIRSQQKSFEMRLSVLQNHSVPNLISVLRESKEAALDRFSSIKAAHNLEIGLGTSHLETKIMQKVNVGLNACDSRSAITKYVKNTLTSDIEAACHDIYTASARYTTDLANAYASAVAEMVNKLRVYYGEIGGVLPEQASLTTSEYRASISDKLTGLGNIMVSYENKIDGAVALGGAGLAALVLTGLGPIGWIVGGIVALGAGDKLFVDSTRGKVRTSVSAKVPEISSAVVQGLINGIQFNYMRARNTLQEKEAEFVAQYTPIYETLERQFSTEKQELTQNIWRSERMQNRIKAVLSDIKQMQGGTAG